MLSVLKQNVGSQMPLSCALVSFTPYIDGTYGFYTQAVLSDGASQEKVLISAGKSNQQFQQTDIGKQFSCVLKSKQNGQYVNISGYVTSGQLQSVAQAAPQTAPITAMPTAGMSEQAKRAMALVAASNMADANNFWPQVKELEAYIETGQIPTAPIPEPLENQGFTPAGPMENPPTFPSDNIIPDEPPY